VTTLDCSSLGVWRGGQEVKPSVFKPTIYNLIVFLSPTHTISLLYELTHCGVAREEWASSWVSLGSLWEGQLGVPYCSP
jgi:hypothetical protein